MKKQKATKKQTKSRNSMWLSVVAIAILAGVAWLVYRSSESRAPETSAQNSSTSSATSQYATLSPSMFTGKARDAYQVAKDIPEVLKQVQCYCGCKRSAGHQSNLDCFTDDHGFG